MVGAWKKRRETAALYRRCEAMLGTLNLPKYFTILELHRRIEQRRERPIHVLSREVAALGPHGLWVAGAHADYVFFDCAAGLIRQHQIIAHQFGHMLFDDQPTEADGDELAALL